MTAITRYRGIGCAIAFAGLLLAGCAGHGGDDPQQTAISVDSLTRLAATAQQGGDNAAAVQLYQKAAAARPNDPDLQVALGQSLYLVGATDDAIVPLRKAITLAPKRIDAHVILEHIYLGEHKSGDALAECDAILALDPRNVRAFNAKGVTLDEIGRSREAQEAYRAALVIDADDQAVRNNLGLSLALSGGYDEAITILSKLANEPGATPRMRQNLALALGLKGSKADAARIARVDLDEAATKSNLQFFDVVRGLLPAAEPAAAPQDGGKS
jgi:Flp pilus assembly protein TadD